MRGVSGRDGCGGSLGTAAGPDRASLPGGWAEGLAASEAAGDNAAHLLPAELVGPARPDGGRDAAW